MERSREGGGKAAERQLQAPCTEPDSFCVDGFDEKWVSVPSSMVISPVTGSNRTCGPLAKAARKGTVLAAPRRQWKHKAKAGPQGKALS